MIICKALHSQVPSCIEKHIELHHPLRVLRSEHAGLLVTRKVSKIRSGGKSFSFLAPFIWKHPGLGADGSSFKPFRLFKSKMKTFLNHKVYS